MKRGSGGRRRRGPRMRISFFLQRDAGSERDEKSLALAAAFSGASLRRWNGIGRQNVHLREHAAFAQPGDDHRLQGGGGRENYGRNVKSTRDRGRASVQGVIDGCVLRFRG